MALKKNVYFSDITQAIIEARVKSQETGFVSFSGQVNEMLKRYDHVMKISCPDLSTAQWQILLNVYNGCIISEYHRPYRIASDMMDSIGAIDITQVEKSDPDFADLVRKMYDFSQLEQMAILDFIQNFWANKWQKFNDFEAIKAHILQR
jgi:zona occludens toxin (predicted ATPase)